ncbi:MAG: hypothetical protein WD674_06295 [Cucumibacter sp.]
MHSANHIGATGLSVLAVCIVPAAVAWAVTAVMRLQAGRLGLVQVPNERSSHSAPTPTGGGAGIAAGGLAATAMLAVSGGSWIWGAATLSLVLGAIGLRDDKAPVPVALRFLAQVVVGGLMIMLFSPLVEVVLPFSLALSGGALAIAAWLGILWWLNLFNFMDGIDGLAGAQAVFMLTASACLIALSSPGFEESALFWWPLGLAAAVGGFLVHNWPPARIFMGDAGSYFLAPAIAAVALASIGVGSISYVEWAIIGASFIADASVTLARRVAAGEKLLNAHREHAYQRLARRFGSHRTVMLGFAAVNLFWLLPLALAVHYWPQFATGWLALAYLPLIWVAAAVRE